MVEMGELSLGVPCASLTLTHYITKNGLLEKKEVVIIGRKFPLKEVRERLLKKQESLMRLNTDEEIDSMGLVELQSMATVFKHTFDTATSVDKMRSSRGHVTSYYGMTTLPYSTLAV